VGPYQLERDDAQITAWFLIGLRHETLRLAKKRNQLRGRELLILNEKTGSDNDDTELIDHIAADSNTLSEVQNKLFLQEALSLLTIQQQKVISATILKGTKEQEVADEMGISKQAVNRIKGRALTRLRNHFRQ